MSARVELGDDDLAQLASGPGDEHDPATRGDGFRHRAAATDRLVVGVGMDRHEGGDVLARRASVVMGPMLPPGPTDGPRDAGATIGRDANHG